MKAAELRQKYLDFFVTKAHKVIKSASLIPENDPTCLFTTAGMHPLVPFLQGTAHPLGKRLTNVQKCIRTGDIESVGDPVHLTFFEMLGNWSLGDYFKDDAIRFSFEFLTGSKWLNIPLEKLAFTVFAGDDDAPFDERAFKLWQELGVSADRIARLPKEDNWWGPAGQTGPCGPDTEMFYWTGTEPAPTVFDPKNRLWVEIWNDVFMQYNKNADGKYEPLTQRNVDTGMGVERVTAVLQGKASCYDTELFQPIFAEIDRLRGVAPSSTGRTDAERIIADHIRASVFIIADGITPGNVDQPYVLRRLIRRAILKGSQLGLKQDFTAQIATVVVRDYSSAYPELLHNEHRIIEELQAEERQFALTLEKGIKEFEKLIARVPEHVAKKSISGKNAFFLYETYGLPLELTAEMAGERGFTVDCAGFNEAFAKHQELSRKGAEQKFKGGLADNSELTAELHTATHIMHAALRKLLGEHVEQRGSNITAERLRFDFCHPDRVPDEILSEVEKMVNAAIDAGIPVECKEMTVEQAKAEGAIGIFGDRYGEIVKVYTIAGVSKEICGGPHATTTAQMGKFKILKEESSSRGIRRIKAVLIKE